MERCCRLSSGISNLMGYGVELFILETNRRGIEASAREFQTSWRESVD
jgi:hypothetical protein